MRSTHNSAMNAARPQVCAGLTKRFHAVAFKKGGKKLAVLKGGGCLGKSALALAPPVNKSRRGDDTELEWPAEMPEARAQLSWMPGVGAGALAGFAFAPVLRSGCFSGSLRRTAFVHGVCDVTVVPHMWVHSERAFPRGCNSGPPKMAALMWCLWLYCLHACMCAD